jgi:hypothetical protein
MSGKPLSLFICHTIVPQRGALRGRKMSHVQLSDVQCINLNVLTAIKIGMLHDKITTCCRFSLDAAQAELLGNLSTEQIWAIVANVGHATLFPPRHDLLSLLQTPLPLAGPLAAVRSPRPPNR